MTKVKEKQLCPHCGTEFTKEKQNLIYYVIVNKTEEQPKIEEQYYKCKDCGKEFLPKELIGIKTICNESRKIEFLTNNKYYVEIPKIFEDFNITSYCVDSVENLSKNQVRVNIFTCINEEKDFPNIKDICSVNMNLINKTFDTLNVYFLDICGSPIMEESYNNVKLINVQRSSVLSCHTDQLLTFGLTFSYETIDYTANPPVNNNIICE